MRTWSQTALGLVLAAGVVFAAGCMSLEDEASEIGESSAAIVGGTPTTAYPAVPLLYSEFSATDGAQLCSGTLISPRVILTAAHCVEFPDGPPTEYLAYFGSDVTVQDDPQHVGTVPIVDFEFHPDWNINDLEAGHDIGVVLLERAAPVPPMGFNRTPIDQLVGSQVHLVGWGRTTGEGEDFGIKRETMSSLQDANPLLMQYGSATANTCQGDSGGPNFMTIDGVEVVAGITSFGNVGCDQYGVGTRVDTFATDFIDPYIAANDPNGSVPGGGDDPGEGGGTDPDDGDTASDAPAGQGPAPVTGGCSAGGGGASGLCALAVLLLAVLTLGRRRARSGA
jgi:secreted trypsin-like serine protease